MLCLLLVAGCSKDKGIEEPDEPEVPVTPVAVTLELSDTDLVFDAEGGQKTFTITSNAEWTITNESEWCTTDVASGTGNRTVTVTSQTYGELEDRNMNLTVKAGDKTLVLGVTQKGKDAIIPDKAKFEVPQEGGDLAIKVRSNVTYEVVIPEFCSSWIQPAPETRSEVSDTTYRFLIAENEEDDARTGFIIFSAASLQDTVRIFQAQKDRLVLTQTNYNLPAKDTTITVELKTNVDYEVSIVGDDISWIEQVETRASRVDRLLFHIDENTSGVLRSAKIAVQDKNGTLSDTVYVRQSPENTLVLGEKEFEVAAEGETISVELTTNTEYNVIIPDSVIGWISCPPETRTLRTDILKFLIAENDQPDERRAVVIIKDRNSGLTDTLRIRQLSNDMDITDKFDPAFAKILQEKGYIPDASRITLADVKDIDTLDVSIPAYGKELTSLAGIEYFESLTKLYCRNNKLTSLDISQNTVLTQLDCRYNNLTSLDVSNNTKLTVLDCSGNPGDGEIYFPLIIWNDYENTLRINTTEWWYRGEKQIRVVLSNEEYSENITAEFDPEFAKVLQEKGYISDATHITLGEVNKIIDLSIYGDTETPLPLTSLRGIEYFTALTSLSVLYTSLTALDVSNNKALTKLDCSFNSPSLTALDVSSCTALKTLDCSYNSLTTLDVSSCTALTGLSCSSNNSLTALNASGCKALTYLGCSWNQNLTTLNVSGCTALTYLDCGNTPLKTLDVSSCTALTYLDCSGLGTSLTTLNVSGCTALTKLNCSVSKLTTLDVSSCTALTSLDCSISKLTTLDVSKNTALKTLKCSSNSITALDVSKNTALTELDCGYNELLTLNISQNTALTKLRLDGNPGNGVIFPLMAWFDADDIPNNIEMSSSWKYKASKDISLQVMNNLISLFNREFAKVLEEKGYIKDVTHVTMSELKQITTLSIADNRSITSLQGIEYLTELTELDCSSIGNTFTTLDVSRNTKLTKLVCKENTSLTTLDVSGCTALTYLSCYKCSPLRTLDVSKCTALTFLDIGGCYVYPLDVSKNTKLTVFSCSGNGLVRLDVSKNTALKRLSCGGNYLKTLDVSQNTELTELSCLYNSLATLDVSKNTALTYLECSYNELAALDVSKNTELTKLDCSWSSLTTLNVSGCTALKVLNCERNQISALDVSKSMALTELHCSYNRLVTLGVSQNAALKILHCDNNQLSTLNVSKSTVLTELTCNNNYLSTLDVSKNMALTSLDCSINYLTTLSVSPNDAALTTLNCSGNRLTTLNVIGCTVLKELNCSSNSLAKLDISKSTALTKLWCENNPGDGKYYNYSYYFPLTTWTKGAKPTNLSINKTSWSYDGKNITIQYQ